MSGWGFYVTLFFHIVQLLLECRQFLIPQSVGCGCEIQESPARSDFAPQETSPTSGDTVDRHAWGGVFAVGTWWEGPKNASSPTVCRTGPCDQGACGWRLWPRLSNDDSAEFRNPEIGEGTQKPDVRSWPSCLITLWSQVSHLASWWLSFHIWWMGTAPCVSWASCEPERICERQVPSTVLDTGASVDKSPVKGLHHLPRQHGGKADITERWCFLFFSSDCS